MVTSTKAVPTPNTEPGEPRLARAVEVGVENGDAQALAAQGPRQGHGDGALADPALARADGQPVTDAGQRLRDGALLRLHLGDDVRAAVADDVVVGLHPRGMIRDSDAASTCSQSFE